MLSHRSIRKVCDSSPPGSMLIVSVAVALAVLISGVFYFRRAEREFADSV